MGNVIVVCGLEREGKVLTGAGLEREGKVLTGAGLRVVPGGGNAMGLAQTLKREAAGADGIVSFGMAGALDPALRIGDWVIGERLTGAFDAMCDPRWADALAARLPGPRRGTCHADGRLIADVAEKRALGEGALAADMESHVAARAAAEAGLPFAIVRCISDEASHALPPAIAVAMRPDGGLAIGAVLASIARNPAQLPKLMRTLGQFNRAYAALREGGQRLTGRLAFDLR